MMMQRPVNAKNYFKKDNKAMKLFKKVQRSVKKAAKKVKATAAGAAAPKRSITACFGRQVCMTCLSLLMRHHHLSRLPVELQSGKN